MTPFNHPANAVPFNERLSNALLLAVALLAGMPAIAAVLHMVVKIA